MSDNPETPLEIAKRVLAELDAWETTLLTERAREQVIDRDKQALARAVLEAEDRTVMPIMRAGAEAERARIVAAIRKRWPENDRFRCLLPPHEVAEWIEEGCQE